MTKRLCVYLLTASVLVAAFGCGDDDGGSTTPTSPTTTTPTNQAPVASGLIPTQILTVGESTEVNVARHFRDPDGDPLTYEATSSNTPVAPVSVSGSTVTITAQTPGQATVTVTARDLGFLNAMQSFSVTVDALPPPPPMSSSCTEDLGTMTGGLVTRIGFWDGSCPSPDHTQLLLSRVYKFTLSQDASVTIELRSPTLPPVLTLLRGTTVDYNNQVLSTGGDVGEPATIDQDLTAGLTRSRLAIGARWDPLR